MRVSQPEGPSSSEETVNRGKKIVELCLAEFLFYLIFGTLVAKVHAPLSMLYIAYLMPQVTNYCTE